MTEKEAKRRVRSGQGLDPKVRSAMGLPSSAGLLLPRFLDCRIAYRYILPLASARAQ